MTTWTPNLDDRMLLSVSALVLRSDERHGFITDDDILDIAIDFTTSDVTFGNDVDRSDYETLRGWLFSIVTNEEDAR